MIAIGFRFPAGRYHATPWGRHPNEGIPEWPPSPWRLLRALLAVWQRKAHRLSGNQVVAVLEKLAEPPEFFLPPATTSHTRHYVPWEKSGPASTTLVLDSFLAVDRQAMLVVQWPNATLEAEERVTLTTLLDQLTYFGRAESWCLATLVDNPPSPNCRLVDSSTAGLELVRALAPALPFRFQPLLAETSDLRGQGRIDPPGSRWLLYARPRGAVLPFGPAPAVREAPATERATVVRFAIAGPVRPRVQKAVMVGELARLAALARFGRRNHGARSERLAGKDQSGKPLAGHLHAHYLPTDEDGRGFLDHLTVWAPGGLDASEVDALAEIDALNHGDGEAAIPLVFLGHGDPVDVRVREADSLFGPAAVWASATPFVCPRHVKWRGPGGAKRVVDGPEDQLRLEVTRRPALQSELVEVEPVDGVRRAGRTIPWYEFRGWREGERPAGPTCGFRLRFAEPVAGPITLGYGSHFGLGLFCPERGSSP